MLSKLDRNARKRLELLQSRSASLEVARPEPRGDELLEQGGLATGGGAERPQVPRVEPVTREAAARGRDLDVALLVYPLAGLDPGRHEVVFLSLIHI